MLYSVTATIIFYMSKHPITATIIFYMSFHEAFIKPYKALQGLIRLILQDLYKALQDLIGLIRYVKGFISPYKAL